jgi:hypothetical protein
MDKRLFYRISNANLHSRPFTTLKENKNGWTVDIITETVCICGLYVKRRLNETRKQRRKTNKRRLQGKYTESTV